MKHSELIRALQNLIGYEPSTSDLSKILDVKPRTLYTRTQRDSEYTSEDLYKLEQHYGIKFSNGLAGRLQCEYTNINQNKRVEQNFNKLESAVSVCSHIPNQFEIVYWEDLSDDMKLSYITSIHLDWELITEDWKVNPKTLRVVPMMGNRMNSWPQPIKNKDVCIIDTSDTDLNNDGIYFFTTNGDKDLFICKLSKKIDGSLIASWHENGQENSRVITPEEQKEVGLEIIGRVIKNLSMVL